MALSQTQIIQSLGEALAWFEKELAWGVAPAELSHLTGRIGELYAAMITRGQMALKVKQRGYDVISAENERISVKTITTSNHVVFKKSTMREVDRLIVLRISVEEGEASIEEVFDEPVELAISMLRESAKGLALTTYISKKKARDLEELSVIQTAKFGNLELNQYENLSILVREKGKVVTPAKPALREIARAMGVPILNGNGNPKNTRSLGADLIAALSSEQTNQHL